ncbi:MAG: radical SAM protein [Spirochaetaceae bacterium]|jgi:hypothetical protein|nr:radical SAM protein [Spirochaetaceae bacterium]
MDHIKRFFDCFIPVTTCNLRCHYCYITLNGQFENKLPEFKHSPQTIGKALSKERLGGLCHFNLCGAGETLLPPETTPIIRSILEQGHYVMVVTNGMVQKRFNEILQFPKEFLARLGFKFSFHFLELKRLNALDSWFNTIKNVRESGCSISVELTPTDECVPYINEIKALCVNNLGALCHITIARDSRKKDLPILTNMPLSQYKETWDGGGGGSGFDSEMFRFKLSTFGIKRKEFCYAGLWSGCINIGTGDLSQCYSSFYSQNIFDDVNKPIKFIPIGANCLKPHCFNSHAWLTLGLIPELKAPAYAQIRNRICGDGSAWLTPEMNAFLSGKLYDSNRLLTLNEQKKINAAWKKKRVLQLISRARGKISRLFKR